jgi:transposase
MNRPADLTRLTDAEKNALIQALWSRIEELEAENQTLKGRLAELEAQQAKTSRNSSKPPSSDGWNKPKPTSQRRCGERPVGGQVGHAGHRLVPVAVADRTIRHRVGHCAHCQSDLAPVAVEALECRQVFDLPAIHLEVTEHQVECKVCPRCGQRNRGEFPPAVTQPAQYGPGVQALIVYLNRYQLIPYDRLAELFADVFGQPLSVGTLVNTNQLCHDRLAPVAAVIHRRLLEQPVVHFDESGVRVEGQRQWLHVASTETLTAYAVDPQRGTAAMDRMGILPGFEGTAVHDHWMPYFTYACTHALCNAHHLRELTFIHEQYDQPWAQQMIACLVTMKQVVDEAKAQGQSSLDPALLQRLDTQYEAILAQGRQQVPPPPPSSGHSRGRPKQSPPKNLLDRLTDSKAAVLAFLYDFRVPFDNNQAERDLRMLKVQQKISGTFRSGDGATSFCRIRGYISTLRKQGCHVLTALRSVFVGEPLLPPLLAQPP